jgi:hypothetical protein
MRNLQPVRGAVKGGKPVSKPKAPPRKITLPPMLKKAMPKARPTKGGY